MTRRHVFRIAALAAAAVAMPVEWAGSALGATPKLTRGAYQRYVGDTFRMTGTGFAASVTLSSVEDVPGASAGDQNRFTVLFTAPVGTPVAPQGIYTFRQSGFGSVDLFAVPVDRGVASRYYQAIVNRTS